MRKPSKYRNKRTNGFASKKEARRAAELRLLEKQGVIKDLRFQVVYTLLDSQEDEAGKKVRPIKYIGDYEYVIDWGDPLNPIVVTEDAKGFRTKEYKLKAKLFLWKFGRSIRET
jgi:hypothetical protein